MENILSRNLNWGDLLSSFLLFLVIYLLLNAILTISKKIEVSSSFKTSFQKALHHLLLIYELVAILTLISVYVLIDPIVHGVIVLVLLIGGFYYVRNYVGSRIILFDKDMVVGNRLQVQNIQGNIAEIGRLGIKLRNNKGLKFINYSTLLREGYTLLSSKEVSGLYSLKITSKDGDPIKHTGYSIIDLWASTPYLDWTYPPELKLSLETPNQFHANIMVKEERHLGDFFALMNDWGYACKTLKK